MRLLGYCTECRKVKYVRVSGQELAMVAARAGVARGVCFDCEEAEAEARRERYRRERGL